MFFMQSIGSTFKWDLGSAIKLSEMDDNTLPAAANELTPIAMKEESDGKPTLLASENAEKENHCDDEESPSSSKKMPCTPALTKVRQSRLEFKVHSPSDALMSPCTKTLNEGGTHKPKSAFSHPQHLLRNKQHKEIMRKRPED